MFAARFSLINGNRSLISKLFGIGSIRCGHRMRGRPPGEARSIAQRLEELKFNNYDAKLEASIDIGFPKIQVTRSEEIKNQHNHLQAKRKDGDLEKRARNLQLEIDVEQVQKEWIETNGQVQIKSIAQHYGIYQHLFGRAHFLPRIPLNIKYQVSEDELIPVHYGNVIKPHEARTQPEVKFDSRINLVGKVEDNTLWTLILTNPDGHFTEKEKEYAHWFVANIPNGDLSKGEVIIPYLAPFPPKGTGFHRHVFILYKQNKKIDFSEYKVERLNDLEKRTFSTHDFYRKLQDEITPSGLAFFQADYDTSLTDFYHKVLEIKEPTFEYDFPKQYFGDEHVFALKKPFNLYLDKYRDPKDINKDFLTKKIKENTSV